MFVFKVDVLDQPYQNNSNNNNDHNVDNNDDNNNSNGFFFQVYPIYHVVLYLEKCMLKDCVFEFMLLCYVLWNINIAKQHCEYKTAMWSIDKSWLLSLLKAMIDYYLYFTSLVHILVDYHWQFSSQRAPR